MIIYRLIAPQWIKDQDSTVKPVIEGVFTPKQIQEFNKTHNIYFLPNHPKEYSPGTTVDGSMVDQFNYVFVDCDLKDGVYTKESFIDAVFTADIPPSRVVDSGNGIHVYWKVSDLDAMSYLRFQRRLVRLFNTDEAVAMLFQLMRAPGTMNIKKEDNQVPCELIHQEDVEYTAEELDKLLPAITREDEVYCKQHYDKTHNLNQTVTQVSDKLPAKFGKLIRDNIEAKQLYAGVGEDRSGNDFRLGHIMLANDFTKDEAMSVLVNSAKALQRAPKHRISYAENIVNKIWTFESQGSDLAGLSSSVEDILSRGDGKSLQGERFPCYKWIDNTEVGFRLGHVMGLVAGSGVGKTTMALNLFKGFVASNPDYDHFFIPLEQTDREIALRWKNMCGENTALHKKVHIISNYDIFGKFRDLSLETIKQYILDFQKTSGKKVGCVVIDHIGILCNTNKLGQDEGVKEISKAMKGFAIETNTFLIMQSQTSREKAGVGDLELNKDAAFGTSVFENFCDYLVTLWQPVKRMYQNGAPTVMAFKFCKIRHKNQLKDVIKEDVCYTLMFDPGTELVRELNQTEEKSFEYFLIQSTNKRKQDRKTEVIPYKSVRVMEDQNESTKT